MRLAVVRPRTVPVLLTICGMTICGGAQEYMHSSTCTPCTFTCIHAHAHAPMRMHPCTCTYAHAQVSELTGLLKKTRDDLDEALRTSTR